MKLKLLFEKLHTYTGSGNYVLKRGDSVRVYHGTDLNTGLLACTQGLSGKDKADRRYSYEYNNNPYGLFISSNFDNAKEFTHSGEGVVLEFDAAVST